MIMKGILVNVLVILVLCSLGQCQSKEAIISYKNLCYNEELKALKESEIYKYVHQSFLDTFEVMRIQYKFFNYEGAENVVDEAVFFKNDSAECILLVLQRDFSPLFGFARVIHGKKNMLKWDFSMGMEFSYSKDYFNLYPRNDFANLSQLARYSVLTKGKPGLEGCKIDEHVWFIEMKD